MVVRVKVKLTLVDGAGLVETAAVANAGYESLAPEIVLPRPLAVRLGLTVKRMRSAIRMLAGGRRITVRYAPRSINVTITSGDREKGPVVADVVVIAGEDEALLSDKLITALGLALEDPGDGLWRFRNEPPEKLRKSVAPEYW